jgi:erythromycin esterase-like protein
MNALPLDEGREAVLELARDARFVLLGEATHGTHEFYIERAELTKRLVAEHGFGAVAVEADWPDAYRVNRYVRGASRDPDAREALGDFRRFPRWMWRNHVVVELVEWLREWNDALPAGRPKTGFYGLDLYSLHASMDAVIRYLDRVAPEAARAARLRYACFDHARDPQEYGHAAAFGAGETCEDDAVAQLLDLQRHAAEYASRNGRIPEDEFFYAEQNARLVANAEEYYRTMFRGRVQSWNLRDTHMARTLVELERHLSTRVVVWAHNSHIGDARATEPGESEELNLGQLAREQAGGGAVLVGFTTAAGTVTAASAWDAEPERKRVRPPLAGSWEELLHEEGGDFVLVRPDLPEGRRLERAIGVIYVPQTERQSHYFEAKLSAQFDAVVHLDETRALEPLERTQEWVDGEVPETYPTGV